MTFKIVTFATLLAVASAGVPLGYSGLHGYAAPVAAYSAAPSVSYAYSSSPAVAKVAAPLAYAAPIAKVASPVAYSTYAAPSYSAYAAPSYSTYAAPSYSAYSAPAYSAYAAPAVAKYAAPVAYAAPAYKVAAPVIAKTVVAEPVGPAVYDFGYSVNDPHTGDSKTQQESRRGDAVQGSYSLIEADGTKRIVEYTADAHNGFNAVVHREPAAVAVKAVAPVAKYAAPLAYAAPVAKIAAPVAYAHAPAYSTYSAAPAYSTYAAPAYSAYSAAPAYYQH